MKKILAIAAIIALSFSITSCTKDLNDYKEDLKELVENVKQANKENDEVAKDDANNEIKELMISAKKNLTPEEYKDLVHYGFSLYK